MTVDWLAAQGLEHLPQYLTALAIGLLIGLERERNPTAKAGLRTFALVALAYSRYARGGNEFVGASRTVIIVANLALLLRVAALAAVLAPGALPVLTPALGAGLAAGIAAYLTGLPRGAGQPELAMPPVANPAELRTALGFAALYAVVLMLAGWFGDLWGSMGQYVLSAASGLADVDAITLSNLRLYGQGQLSAMQASTATVLAVSANVVFKLGIVRIAGGSVLFRRCLPVMAASAAGALAGLALST
jgi:uncharacterized membrane protein (DUF4010 family)